MMPPLSWRGHMAVLRGPAEHRPAGARRGRGCAMLIGCDFCDFCDFRFGNSLCESLNTVSDRESGFPKAVFATTVGYATV